MIKKRLLFVIHRLDAGGAEKSLVSLLNSLPVNDMNIDVMAISPIGIFCDQIPPSVHLVDAPNALFCLSEKITNKSFWQKTNIGLTIKKLMCIIRNHLRGQHSRTLMNHCQFYWKYWRDGIPKLTSKYDVAISYMDGTCNYYVMDKVLAKKKILWMHNDYNKYTYIPSYDLCYFKEAHRVMTISDVCRKSLEDNFPSLKDKFDVLENISSSRIINVQKQLPEHDAYFDDSRFKLISIGRLSPQKGFDYAIDAAKILKDRGMDFCWYIIGEGELRSSLEQQAIQNEVNDVIRFIGIRSNPYPYIDKADIFVMPSRFEGKSIALDEAKILCKPIVVTSYPSVFDAIEDRVTGIITDLSAVAVADGIQMLYEDYGLRECLSKTLSAMDFSNEQRVVKKFIDVIGCK